MLFALPRVSAPDARKEVDGWFTPGRFVVLLMLALFAIFPDVFLGSHTFFYRDYGHFGYPLAHHHRECFWRGELPLWNPYSSCGIPFIAQWNTMVFYPLSLIYLLFPMPWSLGWFVLFHLILGGVGMYFLAHRWVGSRFAGAIAGLGYALNGLTLHSLMWPNNMAALGLMPWVILFTERAWREGGRTLVLATLIATSQMLSGAPEIILFTWLIAGATLFGETASRAAAKLSKRSFSFEWKSEGFPLLRFGVVALLVAGLSAIQLMPFLDLLGHSQRSEGFGDSGWSMPAWGWANLLVPLFHMSPSIMGNVYSQESQQWTSSYYFGVIVLSLAILSVICVRRQRVWFLGILTLFSLLFALGDVGGIYYWFRSVFPQIGFARFPIKFVAIAVFTVPLLAAFAVNSLTLSSTSVPARFDRSLLFLWTGLTFLTVLILVWQIRNPFPDDRVPETLQNGILRLVLFTAAIVFFGVLRRMQVSLAGFWLCIGILVLIGIDALTHTPRQNPTVITQAYERGAALIDPKPTFGKQRAMISARVHGFMDRAANPDFLNYCIGSRRLIFANWNLLDGVPKVNGFYSLFIKEQSDIWSSLYHDPTGPPIRLMDFLGVSQVTDEQIRFNWIPRQTALPLVTGGQMPIFTNASGGLKMLSGFAFDPRRAVFLSENDKVAADIKRPTLVQLKTNSWSAHEITADVDALDPALVVIAQTYYHPWRAFVNDEPVPIIRANHAFQAVKVPAGKSRIRLVYHDEEFRQGASFSAVTLVLLVVLWFATRPAARKSS